MTPKELKLHIGCGGKVMPGWDNIDKFTKLDGILPYDIADLPYKESSADIIYTSHMIEHIHRDEVGPALREWLRVLKPGGKLIIRCPHAPTYLKKWLDGPDEWKMGYGLDCVLGHQNLHAGMLNRNLFTESTLSKTISAEGFKILECRLTYERKGKLIQMWKRGELDLGLKYHPKAELGDIYCVATKEG